MAEPDAVAAEAPGAGGAVREPPRRPLPPPRARLRLPTRPHPLCQRPPASRRPPRIRILPFGPPCLFPAWPGQGSLGMCGARAERRLTGERRRPK